MANLKKEQLFAENVGIVYSTVKRLKVRGCDFEDVLQECFITLLNCCDNFDENKNAKFSTYAYVSIRNTIFDFFRKNKSRTITLASLDVAALDDLNLTRLETSEYLNNLSPRETIIAKMKINGYNLADIGKRLNLTPQRISDIVINSIRKKIEIQTT